MTASLPSSDRVRARPLLVAYFPLGDPQTPLEWLDLYAENKVDFIEFGWPAHNPYLDGPDVRESMERALKGEFRASLAEAKRRLSQIADPPRLLLMTYAESGHAALLDDEIFSGLHSLLVVGPHDDPVRTALEARGRAAGVTISTFLPLPLSEADIAAASRASGYVMLQAAAGLTGPRRSLDTANKERIARLRHGGVTAPVVLGFGVSRGAQARAAVELGADGVVVGSAALRAAHEGRAELDALLRDMRSGLDE